MDQTMHIISVLPCSSGCPVQSLKVLELSDEEIAGWLGIMVAELPTFNSIGRIHRYRPY